MTYLTDVKAQFCTSESFELFFVENDLYGILRDIEAHIKMVWGGTVVKIPRAYLL